MDNLHSILMRLEAAGKSRRNTTSTRRNQATFFNLLVCYSSLVVVTYLFLCCLVCDVVSIYNLVKYHPSADMLTIPIKEHKVLCIPGEPVQSCEYVSSIMV